MINRNEQARSCLTGQARKPACTNGIVSKTSTIDTPKESAHISKVPIQHFNVTVDNLQCHKLVVSRADSTHEEERSVSAVNNLGI